jgi:hypothetical protein
MFSLALRDSDNLLPFSISVWMNFNNFHSHPCSAENEDFVMSASMLICRFFAQFFACTNISAFDYSETKSGMRGDKEKRKVLCHV